MPTTAQLRQMHEPVLVSIAHAGFETALASAIFDNLQATGPLCFNNFAYALREFLRHVFHRLAPDECVTNTSWFKPDMTSQNGITRAHRSKYMLQGGLSDLYVTKKLMVDVDAVNDDLSDVFKVLSSFTHIGHDTFNLTMADIEDRAGTCLDSTKYLIDHIAVCRRRVLDALGHEVDQHLINEVISETNLELDEIATHHRIDNVYVESSEVTDIGVHDLTIDVEGTVGVELQYGSGSDVRNDIGAVVDNSFPFTAQVKVKFQRPLGKFATVVGFKVDTSSWYGDDT